MKITKAILNFWRRLVLGKKKTRGRRRGRPSKDISDLSSEQVATLLNPSLSCREKAAALGMSVGWVSRWERRLREDLKIAFSRSRK